MTWLAVPSPSPTPGPSLGVQMAHSPAFWIVVIVLSVVYLMVRTFDRRSR